MGQMVKKTQVFVPLMRPFIGPRRVGKEAMIATLYNTAKVVLRSREFLVPPDDQTPVAPSHPSH